MSVTSSGEALFLLHLSALKVPSPAREHRFDAARRWRFDFAWPRRKLAVEIEGGLWVQGRHNRGAGYARDLEKYNRAVEMGWKVLRFSTKMVQDGTAGLMVKRMLGI